MHAYNISVCCTV